MVLPSPLKAILIKYSLSFLREFGGIIFIWDGPFFVGQDRIILHITGKMAPLAFCLLNVSSSPYIMTNHVTLSIPNAPGSGGCPGEEPCQESSHKIGLQSIQDLPARPFPPEQPYCITPHLHPTSFTPQILAEQSLCARHSSKCWRHCRKQNGQGSHPSGCFSQIRQGRQK